VEGLVFEITGTAGPTGTLLGIEEGGEEGDFTEDFESRDSLSDVREEGEMEDRVL
jgi:hypothetical protein